MKIVCPHCNYSREVDPAKIPAGASKVTCPRCREKFDLPLEEPAGTDFAFDQAESAPPPPPPREEPAFQEQYRPAPDLDLEAMAREMRTGGQDEPPRFGRDAEEPSGIPWEDRPGGFLGDLIANTRMILFSPGNFFDRMSVSGGKKAPLSFGVLLGSLGTILAIFWQVGASLIFGMGLDPEAFETIPATFMVAGALVLMALTPVLTVIGLYIGALGTHFLLWIVRGARNGFEATFRVFCYTSAAQAWNVIPFLGGFVAAIWSMVLIFMGLSRAHGIGVIRILLALVVVPLLLVILLAVVIGLAAWLLTQL